MLTDLLSFPPSFPPHLFFYQDSGWKSDNFNSICISNGGTGALFTPANIYTSYRDKAECAPGLTRAVWGFIKDNEIKLKEIVEK